MNILKKETRRIKNLKMKILKFFRKKTFLKKSNKKKWKKFFIKLQEQVKQFLKNFCHAIHEQLGQKHEFHEDFLLC